MEVEAKNQHERAVNLISTQMRTIVDVRRDAAKRFIFLVLSPSSGCGIAYFKATAPSHDSNPFKNDNLQVKYSNS